VLLRGGRIEASHAERLRRSRPHPGVAFKYDQRMRGTNLHADLAKVNVNF